MQPLSCERCGNPIGPEGTESAARLPGTPAVCSACRSQSVTPGGERFRCDGAECDKVLPLKLLRDGHAVQVGPAIYCPRCRVRVLGRARRRLELFGRDPLDFGKKVWNRQYWMPITHAQLVTHLVVSRALAAVYPLEADQIISHKEAAPGRRVDPGPGCPLEKIIEAIFDRSDLATVDWLEEFRTDRDYMVRYRLAP